MSADLDPAARTARILGALRLAERPRPTQQYQRICDIADEIVRIEGLISDAIVDRHRTLLGALRGAASTLLLEAQNIEVATFPKRKGWMIDEIVAERRDANARKRANCNGVGK